MTPAATARRILASGDVLTGTNAELRAILEAYVALNTVTPMMLKAAWIEARRWWPRKVVELDAGTDRARFHVVETCIRVDEPQPGFREAIEAALAHKQPLQGQEE